jgi:hypothetical protein
MKLHANARTCPKSRALIARLLGRVLVELGQAGLAAVGGLFAFGASGRRLGRAFGSSGRRLGLALRASGARLGRTAGAFCRPRPGLMGASCQVPRAERGRWRGRSAGRPQRARRIHLLLCWRGRLGWRSGRAQEVFHPANLGDPGGARFELVNQVGGTDLPSQPDDTLGHLYIDLARADFDVPEDGRLDLARDRHVAEWLRSGGALGSRLRACRGSRALGPRSRGLALRAGPGSRALGLRLPRAAGSCALGLRLRRAAGSRALGLRSRAAAR